MISPLHETKGQFWGQLKPLPITRVTRHSPHGLLWSRTQNVLLPSAELSEMLPSLKDYGWFWGEHDDVRFQVEHLDRLEKRFYMWGSAQIHALEWLLDLGKFPLPPVADVSTTNVFLSICSVHAICQLDATGTDLTHARKILESVAESFYGVSDQLCEITPEIWNIVGNGPPQLSISRMQVAATQEVFSTQLAILRGALQSQEKWRNTVTERLLGQGVGSNRGAKRRTIPEYVAAVAGEIYLAAGFERERTQKGKGKSFKEFLARFCVGIPAVEGADKAALARKFWDGSGPDALGPPNDWLSHLRGRSRHTI